MGIVNIAVAAVLGIGSISASAQPYRSQTNPVRQRATIQYNLGWEDMRVEKFEAAAREFQQAIDLDPAWEEAYYSLGRANMALKRYEAAAAAYTKARDLYAARAGRQFATSQDAQRMRRDQLLEIEDRIRYLQTLPPTLSTQDQIRQLQDFRRRQQDNISRGENMTIENSVPVWVSLALGSAYFRLGRMVDAEREYKVAIAADPNTGEAHQNLAVVYLTTQRYAEAERAIEAAKKTGFKVNPALEQEIKDKKRGTA